MGLDEFSPLAFLTPEATIRFEHDPDPTFSAFPVGLGSEDCVRWAAGKVLDVGHDSDLQGAVEQISGFESGDIHLLVL